MAAGPGLVGQGEAGMWLYALDGGQEQLVKPIRTAGTHQQREDKIKSLRCS